MNLKLFIVITLVLFMILVNNATTYFKQLPPSNNISNFIEGSSWTNQELTGKTVGSKSGSSDFAVDLQLYPFGEKTITREAVQTSLTLHH